MAAPSTPASTSAATRAQKHQDAVEQRITQLHSELKITNAQQPQWDTFAQAMRASAQKADQAFKDRAEKLSTMSADDSMKSYAALAQMHADNMQQLSSAFSTLYATLSDTQKATADAVFRYQHPTKRAPMRHKRKPEAPASAPAAASN